MVSTRSPFPWISTALRPPLRSVFSCLLLLLSVLCLAGCESLAYYSQAIGGHLQIQRQRQNIDTLIRDDATDPALRARLQTVMEIRDFAANELSLPVGRNFSTYVDLQRPFAVWNVFAAPEFSLQPRRWCYPVAGCVSYRGYYSEERARAKARELADSGLDVYVGGVAAYSTLGWFSDPLLNTIINREEHRLAGLIFHEMAHQVTYVKGDTAFNEGFATTVEREGLRRWLLHSGSDEQQRAAILAEAQRDSQRQEDFVALVQGAIGKLRLLYQQPLDEGEMRTAKSQILEELRRDYAQLRQQWDGYDGYDGWFSGDLNNARLLTVATYNDLVPAFDALLEEHQGNLPGFYDSVRALSRLSVEERQARLSGLLW